MIAQGLAVTLSIGSTFLWEVFIVVWGFILLAKFSYPLPGRRRAQKEGKEANFLRAESARKAAESRYSEEHPLVPRMASLSLTVFFFAVGTTMLVVGNTSSTLSSGVAVGLLVVQVGCVITFLITQRTKNRAIWPYIREAWEAEPQP